MATVEFSFLQGQLEERKRRLEMVLASEPQKSELAGLLREVDAALDRMAEGTYGLCVECHDAVERDRLLADPLVRYCLDHLSKRERDALQRDLDLASKVLQQKSAAAKKKDCASAYGRRAITLRRLALSAATTAT